MTRPDLSLQSDEDVRLNALEVAMIGIVITFIILAHFINHCYGPHEGQACRI